MKKKIIILSLLISTFVVSYAQKNANSVQSGTIDQKEERKWINMRNDLNVNFYDVQDAFNSYYKDRYKGKGSGWKQFKRWEYFMEQRVYPDGKRLKHSQLWDEMMKFNKNYPSAAYSSKSNWSSLGPTVWNDITGHWNPGIGRINVIARDPADSMIIYIGSPSGGLWKTTDEGENWQSLADHLPIVGVSAIAIHPTNTDIMYIGTGDKDTEDNYSIGVLKSTDGGQNWVKTGIEWNANYNRTIAKLLINPEDPEILYAATSSGLFRTTDGGINWEIINGGAIDDMEFKPGNPDVIYFNTSRFYKSADGGDSFEQISGLPVAGRVQIAVTEANPDYVYFFASQDGIWRSEDSGETFTKMSNQPNQGNQDYYDLGIAASHTDPEEVLVGEIEVYRSSNGGASWIQATSWNWPTGIGYTHADIHEMVYYGGTLYIGSDGLITKSTDGGRTYQSFTEGLGIRQFYRIGVSKSNPYKILGGSQDNGTSVYTDDHWHEWRGADGMECIVDYTNDNIVYGTSQNGTFYKSNNGGDEGNVNITQPGEGDWITPFAIHPTNPQILYVGLQNVRYTNNGMQSWITISSFPEGLLSCVTISESDPDYLYVAKSSSVYKSVNGGNTWEDISGNIPNYSITYISIHPSDPQKIAISFSGFSSSKKVYVTENAGDTWINMTANLPNIPANCVAFNDDEYDGLYVGMDVGIYYRDNTMDDWIPFMNNLPNVIVSELEISPSIGKIRAGTYGRGLWESDLYPTIPKELDVSFTVHSGDDEIIQYGETVSLDVTIKNKMGTAVNNLNMAISIDDDNISLSDVDETIGSLEPGAEITFTEAFEFDVSISIENNHELNLISTLSSDDQNWEINTELIGFAPDMRPGTLLFEGGENVINPGESNNAYLTVKNIGGAVIENLSIEVSSADNLISVLENQYEFEIFEPYSSQTIYFHVDISDQVPADYSGNLRLLASALNYERLDTFKVHVGNTIEDFESGDIEKLSWVLQGNEDWFVQEQDVYEGRYSIQSGEIDDQDESILSVELLITEDGQLSFQKKVCI